MKFLSWLVLASILIVSQTAQADGSTSVTGVSCGVEKNGKPVPCTESQLKEIFQAMQSARSGAENQNGLAGTARTVGKGLVLVGGTWFSLAQLLTWSPSLNAWAWKALGEGIATDIGIGGWLVGGPMAAVGGIILALTPSTAHAGTLSEELADKNALGRVLKLDEKSFLTYSKINPQIAQNVVNAAAELAQKAREESVKSDPRVSAAFGKQSAAPGPEVITPHNTAASAAM